MRSESEDEPWEQPGEGEGSGAAQPIALLATTA